MKYNQCIQPDSKFQETVSKGRQVQVRMCAKSVSEPTMWVGVQNVSLKLEGSNHYVRPKQADGPECMKIVWVAGATTPARRTTSQENVHTVSALCFSLGPCPLPIEKGPCLSVFQVLPGELCLVWPSHSHPLAQRQRLQTGKHDILQMGLFCQHSVVWKVQSKCFGREQIFSTCMMPLIFWLSYICMVPGNTWVCEPSLRYHHLHEGTSDWLIPNLSICSPSNVCLTPSQSSSHNHYACMSFPTLDCQSLQDRLPALSISPVLSTLCGPSRELNKWEVDEGISGPWGTSLPECPGRGWWLRW